MVGKAATVPILIVEDEFLVRMALIDQLEDAGFEVLEAATAVDAFASLEERPDIRLIFTDIHMPGDTDGLTFAREVSQRWPDMGIILTSGQSTLSEADLPSRSTFIPKPYRFEDVAAAIGSFLAPSVT